MANLSPITVLLHDTHSNIQVPKGPSVKLLKRASTVSKAMERSELQNLFVFSAATELEAVSPLFRASRSQNLLRALFVRRNLEDSWFATAFTQANIRSLRKVVVYDGSVLIPQRVLNAWSIGAQHHLIADAKVEGEMLVVRDCAFQIYAVPTRAFPSLAALSGEALSAFEISESGSYIHWPADDIHLGIEAFKYALDARFRAQAERRRSRYHLRFGQAVAQLRKTHGLRQTDILGISAKQVGRLERGLSQIPRTQTLTHLAKAHGLSLDAYLDALGALFAESGGGDLRRALGQKS